MLLSAFIIGVLGSFHCIGMCGPIAFMLPVDHTNTFRKIGQISIYHAGRLLAYSIIGIIFGIIGKGLYIFGFQQRLSIFIGILMILIVLTPTRIFNNYNFSKPLFRIISKVKSSLGKALKKKTPETFLTIGFLNGFLPCGLVYMALIGALASGSAISGGLYMVLFGLGTIPLMTTAIYISKFLSTYSRQAIKKVIPILVVVIGVWFIFRGLGLGIPYFSPEPVQDLVSNSINCH